MKKMIFLVCLLSCSAQAAVEVKNPFMKKCGIQEATLMSWLSPNTKNQAYDGEYAANLISPKLFDDHGNAKEDCIKFSKIPPDTPYKRPVYLLSIRPSCLDESLSDDYKLKLIFKPLPFHKYEREGKKYVSHKRRIKELRYLTSVQEKYQGEKFNRPGLPRIAALENHYKVQLENSEDDYFSVFHAAEGFSLYGYLNSGVPTKKVQEVFQTLGHQLANFHLKFMDMQTVYDGRLLNESTQIAGYMDRMSFYKTVTHSDPHLSNLFYDPKSKKITFIDVETMGQSILFKKFSIHRDMEAIIMRMMLFGNGLKKMNLDFYLRVCASFKAFLNTYINTYPPEMHDNLALYIISFLNNHRITTIPAAPHEYHKPNLSDSEVQRFNSMMKELVDFLKENYLHYENESQESDTDSLIAFEFNPSKKRKTDDLNPELTEAPASGDNATHDDEKQNSNNYRSRLRPRRSNSTDVCKKRRTDDST